MKNNTREQWNSLIRTTLTFIGALLTGGGVHYFFGQLIDTAYWQEITGIVLASVSVVWSIKDKKLGIEQLQATVRQVITFAFGILMAKGLISENTANSIFSFIGSMLPFLQQYLSKKKANELYNGEIKVDDLSAPDNK